MASSSSTIKAIDRSSVHRICSGQVIVDLATAVKELVENAMDAGATSVDVRLREQGIEAIEVADNGSGIPPSDYADICRKHHTSKLGEFNDLLQLATYGFRGEALSSLCALGGVTLVTRTEAETVGTQLTFAASGEIESQTPISRAVGTTVIVNKVFSALPVRRQELVRNIKRDYARLLSVMQAYAVVNTTVRFSVSNTAANGRRTTLINTIGRGTLREAVVNVYGARLGRTLRDFDRTRPGGGERIVGLVSAVGEGRNSADKQNFFLNGRPVDLPAWSKTINDVFSTYNSAHPYPVLFLNIHMPPDEFDVNVTPDKRKCFILKEKDILEYVKAELDELFSPTAAHSFAVRSMEDFGVRITPRKTATQASEDEPATPEADGDAEAEVEAEPESEADGDGPVASEPVPDDRAQRAARKRKARDIVQNLRTSKRRTVQVAVEHEAARTRVPEPVAQLAPESDSEEEEEEAEADEIVVLHAAANRRDKSATSVRVDAASIVERARRRSAAAAAAAAATVEAEEMEEDGSKAVDKLRLVLAKGDFARMHVIGQFNRSFIVARLREHVFIIDQHATDEKYMFETLQQTTTIHKQNLISAMPLELTASEEIIVMDNLDVFKQNGFNFAIDPDAVPGQRLALTSMAFSKGTTFTTHDVNELIDKLTTSRAGAPVRLSKVTRMFASRACRSAVMFGTSLERSTMVRIVRHMEGLDQPWNCPHGRPTMRHLVCLPKMP